MNKTDQIIEQIRIEFERVRTFECEVEFSNNWLGQSTDKNSVFIEELLEENASGEVLTGYYNAYKADELLTWLKERPENDHRVLPSLVAFFCYISQFEDEY